VRELEERFDEIRLVVLEDTARRVFSSSSEGSLAQPAALSVETANRQ
jgi:hypothetical protein